MREPKFLFFLGLLGATGALSFLVLLIVLHGLRRDLSPIGSFVSDYANGRYGSLFRSVLVIHGFGNLATASGLACIFAASRYGLMGAALFGAAAVGTVLGGLFSIDPVSGPRTTVGIIHTIVASVSFPIEACALIFFSCVLAGLDGSRSFSRITRAAAVGGVVALAWLLVAVMAGSVPGLAERAVFAVFLMWEILAAIFVMRKRTSAAIAQDA